MRPFGDCCAVKTLVFLLVAMLTRSASLDAANGFRDEALARPPPTNFIGSATQPVTLLSTFFPNREVGFSECVPGAIVSILKYLNARFALGMESIKTATGWTTNGANASTWPDLKAQSMMEQNLPVSTLRTNRAASAAQAALEAGCDVEISMVGHEIGRAHV